MLIREAQVEDATEWLRMRMTLWPDADWVDLLQEIAGVDVGPPPCAAFVAVRETGKLGGLIEVSTRPYADGCDSSPVGYVEAWYVDPDLRLSGIGKALMDAAEEWAVAQGYSEMGSDTEIDNEASLAAHLALGFDEMDRIICFRKRLD